MRIPSEIRWKSTGRTLGEGGQATVVEVEDSRGELTGKYALKGLASGKPAKAYERFAREVEAIKAVSHPNIIRIVDHADPGAQFHFYVMELLEGATALKKVIGTDKNHYHGNALAGLSLFIDLLQAIEACEQKGIVHRDMSPANVLVLPNNSIKIIDFGICQADEHETITLTDEGVGTPTYMAPECESGAGRPISSQADLYSAGKIVWSAVTNLHAFAREAPAFNHKSMYAIFPDNPALWHLHHIFEKTVRNNAKDRWRSAGEALKEAYHVRYLVASHYPPIELISERCPLCGVGKLGPFDLSHMVFGNPNPKGITALQCSYCGFCFAKNVALTKELLKQRSQLQ